MFQCPNCKAEAKRLIAPSDRTDGKLFCNACYGPVKKHTNCNLGQTVDSWVKADGSRGRVTVGKKWEIEHRRINPEDKMSVINYATGKESQY